MEMIPVFNLFSFHLSCLYIMKKHNTFAGILDKRSFLRDLRISISNLQYYTWALT